MFQLNEHIFLLKLANSKEEFEQARHLLLKYAEELNIDLGFQNFESELNALSDQYTKPKGGLLIAYMDEEPIGCVGVRIFENKIAELKRMYVLPASRKNKIGYLLLTAAIELARELNFYAIRLDTLPTMTSAINLYQRIGFKEIEPYRYNPIEGTKYFELELRK